MMMKKTTAALFLASSLGCVSAWNANTRMDPRARTPTDSSWWAGVKDESPREITPANPQTPSRWWDGPYKPGERYRDWSPRNDGGYEPKRWWDGPTIDAAKSYDKYGVPPPRGLARDPRAQPPMPAPVAQQQEQAQQQEGAQQ